MENDIAIIKNALENSKLFEGVPMSQIENVLPYLSVRRKKYKKGDIVILPNEQIGKIGIVMSGAFDSIHIGVEGEQSLISQFLPYMALAADVVATPSTTSPYLVEAAKEGEVAWIPANTILEEGFLGEGIRVQVLLNLLMILSNENVRRLHKIEILSYKQLRQRIIEFLHMWAKREGSNSYQLPLNREEMAKYLCVNRSALSHELSLMRSEGLISFRKNCFKLEKIAYDF